MRRAEAEGRDGKLAQHPKSQRDWNQELQPPLNHKETTLRKERNTSTLQEVWEVLGGGHK